MGEAFVRFNNLTIDVPKSYQDKNNLIRYFPNQSGNYLGGKHKWIINKYGFPGYEPKSLKSLIGVIGDSYISNFMNPPECHQAEFLSKLNPRYNFYPLSRDGANLLEMLELSKLIDTLDVKFNLLFISDGDIFSSITNSSKPNESIQISLSDKKIHFPKYKTSKFKETIYNFKFFYYLYRNFIVKGETSVTNKTKIKEDYNSEKIESAKDFLNFVNKEYHTNKIIFVFKPNSSLKIYNLFIQNNLNAMILNSDNDKSWQLPDDGHWSCYGHQRAAEQVTEYLNTQNEKLKPK